jgi:hypothetical protein
MTHDARSLRNDDVIDSLSYALTQVGAVFASDPSEYIAAARTDWNALAQMPLRRRILDAETLEEFSEIDEIEMSLRLKLDHALNVQIEDVRAGTEDPTLQRHIEQLQRDLAKYNAVGRPQAVNRAAEHQPGVPAGLNEPAGPAEAPTRRGRTLARIARIPT